MIDYVTIHRLGLVVCLLLGICSVVDVSVQCEHRIYIFISFCYFFNKNILSLNRNSFIRDFSNFIFFFIKVIF